MSKYYYQRGMCETLHYVSLNPVLYEKSESGAYTKVQMDCSCIEKGECDKSKTCQLLIDAPEKIEDDGINLRNRKY